MPDSIDIILKRIINKFAPRMDRSVKMNFQKGGRPDKWKPSYRSELLHKSQIDKKNRTGMTLIDKGILRNSIRTVSNFQKKEITIGTSVVYGAIHNFGGEINGTFNVREHNRKISQAFGKPITPRVVQVQAHSRTVSFNMPKREFLMIQKDDIDYLNRLIKDELNQSFKNQ